jgi:hypothetical protein
LLLRYDSVEFGNFQIPYEKSPGSPTESLALDLGCFKASLFSNNVRSASDASLYHREGVESELVPFTSSFEKHFMEFLDLNTGLMWHPLTFAPWVALRGLGQHDSRALSTFNKMACSQGFLLGVSHLDILGYS